MLAVTIEIEMIYIYSIIVQSNLTYFYIKNSEL